MSTEQNKSNSRRFLEDVCNRGNLDLLNEIADPNCVTHQADGALHQSHFLVPSQIGHFPALLAGASFRPLQLGQSRA